MVVLSPNGSCDPVEFDANGSLFGFEKLPPNPSSNPELKPVLSSSNVVANLSDLNSLSDDPLLKPFDLSLNGSLDDS